MKKNLIIQTLLLTISSLIARAIGLGLRVYISNKIGAEGMGLYTLVISVYMLFATFATSGISICVSKFCAEEIYKGNFYAARKIVRIASTSIGVVGLIAAILMFFSSNFIGIVFLKDIRTISSLKILSIGLPFLSLSSCFTGYFYAARNVVKPASAQIFEQFIKISSLAFLFSFWKYSSLEFLCCAVVLSITIADVGICLYQFLLYNLEKKNYISKNFSLRNTVARIFSMTIPLAANSYINSALRLFENILIPISFKKSGLSTGESMEKYGLIKGMVLPILIFPSAFLTSLASILVPTVAGVSAASSKTRLNNNISKVISLTIMLGIFILAIFVGFSHDIGLILYNNADASKMLFSLSFICPFLYLEMVVVAILNGLGRQFTALWVNLLDSGIRISVIYFLVPFIGVNGFIVAITSSSVISTCLYMRKLILVTGLQLNIHNQIVNPILAAIISLSTIYFLNKTITTSIFGPIYRLSIGVVIISVIYFIVLIILGSIKKDDVKFLLDQIKSKG